MSVQELPPLAVLALNIGGWLIVHLGVSYLLASLPQRWFAGEGWRSLETGRSSKGKWYFERGAKPKQSFKSGEERFYDQVLFIRAWKDRMPDGSFLFRKGFQKKGLLVEARPITRSTMGKRLEGNGRIGCPSCLLRYFSSGTSHCMAI